MDTTSRAFISPLGASGHWNSNLSSSFQSNIVTTGAKYTCWCVKGTRRYDQPMCVDCVRTLLRKIMCFSLGHPNGGVISRGWPLLVSKAYWLKRSLWIIEEDVLKPTPKAGKCSSFNHAPMQRGWFDPQRTSSNWLTLDLGQLWRYTSAHSLRRLTLCQTSRQNLRTFKL